MAWFPNINMYNIMQEKEESRLRKGPWLEGEDHKLVAAVGSLGERRWDALAKASGLKRSGKSCRLRWMNYLHPNIKRTHITPEEELLIIELQRRWGNKWAKIAKQLPGRTDNDIKNYWRSHLRKKDDVIHQAGECCVLDNSPTEAHQQIMNSSACVAESDHDDDKLKDANFSYATSSPYQERLWDWINIWSCSNYQMEHHIDDGDYCNTNQSTSHYHYSYITTMSDYASSSSIWDHNVT